MIGDEIEKFYEEETSRVKHTRNIKRIVIALVAGLVSVAVVLGFIL